MKAAHQDSYKTKLLIFIDSNRRFLQPRKLWSTNGTTWKHAARLSCVTELLADDKSMDLSALEAILVSCGVNDSDYMEGEEVHKHFISTIDSIRQRFPHIKILVSELTPRNDDKDPRVVICNRLLEESICAMENVILIKHSNLRDSNWSNFRDSKHIKKESISIYASNIKRGLRMAFNTNNKPARQYDSYNNGNVRNSGDINHTYESNECLTSENYQATSNIQIINQVIVALKGLLR